MVLIIEVKKASFGWFSHNRNRTVVVTNNTKTSVIWYGGVNGFGSTFRLFPGVTQHHHIHKKNETGFIYDKNFKRLAQLKLNVNQHVVLHECKDHILPQERIYTGDFKINIL